MKKKKAVMLADTRPALVGIMLLQLKNTNPDLFDEAIIFDVNLTEQDRQLMQAIFPCRFMEYQSPLSKELLRLERFQRFSLIMFARYEMFRLLDEYNTIMWIDTDMVIQGSLSDLLAETEGYGLSILREDPQNKSAESTDCMRTNFVSPISGYQMDAYLCCTGLIIVRDVLHQVCDYTEWCYRKTIEWADNLNMPDQGVINALIQHFGIQIKPIGHRGKYGCWPFPGRDCSGAILVHAWGPNKFWNDWYLYNKFPNWEDCHREWISRGGKALFEELYPTVSVLIPIYKPDLGYLKQCLDSMLDQRQEDTFYKFTDFEVLLLAEPFGKRTIEKAVLEYDDPRLVLLFNEERKGIAASLNRGLKEAKGRYIARMDDDDICADSRFRKQVSFLNHHPEISMCVSDYEYFGDMNEGRIIPEGELSRAWSVLTCPFDHPTVMFRKSFFEANQLYYDENRKYAEDWDLWIRAFEHGMKVGCIHEPLLYHRWHSGNAGQTEASNDQMKATVQDNFRKFGVEIPWEYVPVFCPWWGKAWNEDALSWLKTGFEKALETNRDLNLYDQSSLEKVFSLRMAEAETGVLPEMSWNRYQEHHPLKEKSSEYSVSQVVTASVARRPSRIRLFLKKLFKPLYQPIRHRFEDRLIDIQRATWEIHHTSKENMEGISRVIEMQQQQIDLLNDRLDQMSEEISQIHRLFSDLEVQNNQTFQEISYQMAGEFCAARHVILESLEERSENSYQALSTEVYEQAEDTRQALSAKVYEQAEYIRQALSAKVYEQAEDTRQTLSSKVYEQAEDTRQALSAKVYEQAEDTRQMLSGKVFEQAENTRQKLSGKVFEQAEDTRQMLSGKVFEQAEDTRQMLSGKVFEQAEDTRQMLSGKVFEQAENTRQMLSGKVFEQAENTRQTMDSRIWKAEENILRTVVGGDWNLHFDIMKELSSQKSQNNIIYDDFFYWDNRYGSVLSAKTVLSKILQCMPIHSIIDFGCGTGTWLWVAHNMGVAEITGIDGDYVPREMLMIPENCFYPADLSSPYDAGRIYDLAISMEVGEHLPESASDIFVSSICKSAEIVLFSAAHPGQGGDGHINEQKIEYWIEKFGRKKYKPVQIRNYFLNEKKIEPWYKENLILFVLESREMVVMKQLEGIICSNKTEKGATN